MNKLARATKSYSQQLTQQLLAVISQNERRISTLEGELDYYRKQDVAQQQLTVENVQVGKMISQERFSLEKEKRDVAADRQRFVEERRDFAGEKMAFEAERQKVAVGSATSPAKIQDATIQDRENADAQVKEDRAKKELPKTASICYWAFGSAKQQFNANPKQVDWSDVRLPPSFNVDINDERVKQLHRHDYYKGWLDSMSAFDTLQAWSDGEISLDALQYLFDLTDIRSPMDAGRNVGVIFDWSAICNHNDRPEHDARLDDRVWGLHQLVPRSEHILGSGKDFWQGVKWGKEIASGLFEMKIESGIWQISKDPKQVEYLKEACRRGRES